MGTENLVVYGWLKSIFVALAVGFALFTVILNARRKRWGRILLDLFLYCVFFPLWLAAGVTILVYRLDWAYSWFPGLWFCFGLLIWLSCHTVMTILALRRKLRFEAVVSFAGLCTVACSIALIYFWDMTKNAF